jgi:hypothetical protein
VGFLSFSHNVIWCIWVSAEGEKKRVASGMSVRCDPQANLGVIYIFAEIQKDIYTEVMPNVWRKNSTIG